VKPNGEKLLVVESDDAVRRSIVTVLSDAGYEISTQYRGGMKSVLDFSPEVVILGANPPQLDCCDLLSEIKGSEHTQNIRVIMLAPGGSPERSRGLDLGADDVLSVPFDSHELLSRVRWQLRSKKALDDVRQQVRLVEENRTAAEQVVTAVNQERRTLRRAGALAVAGLIVVAVVFLVSYHRTQEQTARVYTAITRLQTGILTQQRFMERSRRALEDVQHNPSLAADSQKLQLRKRSEDLKVQIASGKTENVSALEGELSAVENRLRRLETQGEIAQTIIQSYEPSVCLLHVVVGFRDHTTGLKLHYVGTNTAGEPLTDEHNNPLLAITGKGPEVHLDVFGTGFLVSDKGQILTNHHVAEPWWENDDLKQMIDQGVDPLIIDMQAYFPSIVHGISMTTEKISPEADVALLKGDFAELGIKQIAFAEGRSAAVSGRPVVPAQKRCSRSRPQATEIRKRWLRNLPADT
jgi:CheY-like chemotaxis protein